MLRFLIFFALLFALALYFLINTETKNNIRPSNPATQTKNTTKPTTQNDENGTPMTTSIEPPFNIGEDQLINIDTPDIKKLDYVSAYRDWQYFKNCYTDVEDFGNNKDPLETLKERFINNWRESQSEPTHQQNIYYQHHVDICKTLINDVGGEKDNYNQILYNLHQRFDSLTPKTDEGKQLEQALKLKEKLESLKREYSYAHYPVSSLSIEEQTAINSTIQQLTLSIMKIYDGTDELSPEQVQDIKNRSDEIDVLQNKLNQRVTVDPEKIKLAEQSINAHLNSMDSYLMGVKSPDAFLIIAAELFRPEFLQQDSDIMHHIKSHTQIYDNYYLGILNNLVHPLVACSMDYPCDAQSDLILSYCLGLKDSMFNQACGLSLEDFYFNFYIGTNQLYDVNKYFNYLVSRYAN